MDKASGVGLTPSSGTSTSVWEDSVFLLGKKAEPVWELVDTKNTEAKLLNLISTAQKRLFLVTPWATLGELGSIRRAILLALQRGVETTLVVRDEDKTLATVIEDAQELLAAGMKLFSVHRLHAKIYWSEEQALLTSANLIEGSFDKSIEFGLLVSGGELHGQVKKFIEGLPPARRFAPASESKKQDAEASGHCIRCREEIPFSEQRPYCGPHYEKWAEYKNPNYPDRYCHGCGKEHPATKRKPLCRNCYEQQNAA